MTNKAYHRLFIALVLFSGTLVGLTAARLYYTTHLPPGDPLNNGRSFFDPVVAELLATALITFLCAIYKEQSILRSVLYPVDMNIDAVVIGCLWVLYLIGAAIATSFWGDLSFCWQNNACRVLTAMVAFAWIGWLNLSLLLLTTLTMIGLGYNEVWCDVYRIDEVSG